MSSKACSLVQEPIQALTKQEIDRRIQVVLAEVSRLAAERADGDAFQPRWIRASDLVRRVAPFLCSN